MCVCVPVQESLVLDDRPPQWNRSEVYRKLSLDESRTQLLPFFVSPDGPRPYEGTVHSCVGWMCTVLN
jgi:hypothetical protein